LPIDWTRAIRNRNGSTAVEYAVLLALMILVVTAPLMLMGKTVSKTFIDVDGAFVSSSRSPAGNPSAVRGSAAAPVNSPSDHASLPTGSIGSSEGAPPTSQVAGLSTSLLATVKDRADVGYDNLPEISLFLLSVLLIIPLYLYVRRTAGRGVIVSKQFVDLAYALINDAVCIVSPHVKVRMGGNDSIREMMKGIECLGPRSIPSSSVSERNLGLQAACVVLAVYGKQPSDVEIPENILYEGAGVAGDFQARLKRGLHKLHKSDDRQRDQYNIAFNLVVDLWLKAFAEHKLLVTFPSRGSCRRDTEKNLRLFTYCAPDATGHVLVKERTVLTSG